MTQLLSKFSVMKLVKPSSSVKMSPTCWTTEFADADVESNELRRLFVKSTLQWLDELVSNFLSTSNTRDLEKRRVSTHDLRTLFER